MGVMTMARNRPLVAGSAAALAQFKQQVMQQRGLTTASVRPEDVKFEVAEELGIPLVSGDNGELTTRQAGRIGGPIGGQMVREMIRMAEQLLSQGPQ